MAEIDKGLSRNRSRVLRPTSAKVSRMNHRHYIKFYPKVFFDLKLKIKITDHVLFFVPI